MILRGTFSSALPDKFSEDETIIRGASTTNTKPIEKPALNVNLEVNAPDPKMVDLLNAT